MTGLAAILADWPAHATVLDQYGNVMRFPLLVDRWNNRLTELDAEVVKYADRRISRHLVAP